MTSAVLTAGSVVTESTKLFGHFGHQFSPWHCTVSLRFRTYLCLQRKPLCPSSTHLLETQRQQHIAPCLDPPNLAHSPCVWCASSVIVTAKFEPNISLAQCGSGHRSLLPGAGDPPCYLCCPRPSQPGLAELSIVLGAENSPQLRGSSAAAKSRVRASGS